MPSELYCISEEMMELSDFITLCSNSFWNMQGWRCLKGSRAVDELAQIYRHFSENASLTKSFSEEFFRIYRRVVIADPVAVRSFRGWLRSLRDWLAVSLTIQVMMSSQYTGDLLDKARFSCLMVSIETTMRRWCLSDWALTLE